MTQHTIDVTAADFMENVVEKSMTQPVLVDFWADWCEPCKMLAPVLEQLAEAHKGQLTIAKVDTDKEQEIAMQLQIRSLPTLKLFHQGQIVEEITGVQPPQAIQAMLEPYLQAAPEDNNMADQHAAQLMVSGDTQGALSYLQSQLQEDPENISVITQIIECLLHDKQIDNANEFLNAQPDSVKEEASIVQLITQVKLLKDTESLDDVDSLQQRLQKDENDLDAAYQLAIHMTAQEQYEAAMELLLNIVRNDRGFMEDGARKKLLEIFTLLGNGNDLVRSYRRKLASILN